MNDTIDDLKRILFEDDATHPAAIAIQTALDNLMDIGVVSEDEFMRLIDLTQRDNWASISRRIAERLEVEVRHGTVSSKDVKPWVMCSGYKNKFGEIVDQKAWRSANGAISSIVSQVDTIFGRDN